MEIIFHSHVNKTHFHKKGCAPSLILKVRVFGTRKWSIHAALKSVNYARLKAHRCIQFGSAVKPPMENLDF